MTPPHREDFACTLDDVHLRIQKIDTRAYDKTRNYLDGAATWLSPFITHGITTTSEVAQQVLQQRKPSDCYRLLYELGWREYFHRTWQKAGDEIFEDMRQAQVQAESKLVPASIVNANTGIDVVDHALEHLYSDGTMHNHARMWTAAMVCNMARAHWYEPARFFHYHLLDGDLASNTLSWQWIAGTFSHKQYFANQENINKYARTNQSGTWLDVPYDVFDSFGVPSVLDARVEIKYDLRPFGTPIVPLTSEVALRSIWQLDPRWQKDIGTHIVFVDSNWLSRWPLSPHRKDFIQHWATQCNATVMHGTTQQLRDACAQATVTREEYPACRDWPGQILERAWLYPLPEKSFTSFSQFFKQVKSSVRL